MHDTLAVVVHTKVCQAELLHIVFECHDLQTRVGLFNEGLGIFERFSRGSGNVLLKC
jgi:hypothetical protein